MLPFAIPRWAWAALGGLAVCAIALLMFRTAISNAEARGYDRAMREAAEAAAAASRAYQAQVDSAARELAEARVSRRKALRSAQQAKDAYYEANPAAGAVVCLPDERVQAQTQARARIHSQAATGGRDAL